MTIDQRIGSIRKLMAEANIDAYLIPGNDPHQSEYAASYWASRTWISGFDGSAGLVIITASHAGLWTDSRYFLQAEKQLAGSQMKLHKQLIPHAPEHISWLKKELPEGSTIGCDGKLFSVGQIRSMAQAFHEKDFKLSTSADLISPLWTDRPSLSDEPIFELDSKFTGQTRQQKLEAVRNKMAEKNVEFYLLSTLDDIAWLFNLRGKDVAFNPVFTAYAVIGKTASFLFLDKKKVPDALKDKLAEDSILISAYDEIEAFLKKLSTNDSIWVDRSTLNIHLYNAIDVESVVHGENIVRDLKAIKNNTEVGYIRQAMRKDGIALTRLFRWLYESLSTETVTEVEVAEKLEAFRAEQGDYHGESFAAIVGYEANGAIVHYRPMPNSCATIRPEGILLLDSGGQYTQGTTDITRTVALGFPSSEQKRHFTLVLKGHIALATIKFPEGTKGIQLDTLARQFLWRKGLDYGHGTGHGVGFFLNVHEPPQGFATSVSQRGITPFKPGMFTSNEPGFYKTGAYGIRIENLVLTRQAATTDYGAFLEFETLTLFPIDRKLIELELLDAKERDWLNAYHKEVFDTLAPLLNDEEVEWMREQCRPLS